MFNLKTEVKLCADQFVQTGAEFTAYDITQELRRLHPGADIPHASGVREIIHALFEDGDLANYNRELDYSLGITPAPWKYYPGLSTTGNMHRVYPHAPQVTVKNFRLPPAPKNVRQICQLCHKPLHKKGFGMYHVQRYRCFDCGIQANEFTGTVFHNRKHRPAKILDALWCLKSGKPNICAANAVGVDIKTVLTWRRVTKQTWLATSKAAQKLDGRFDQAALDQLFSNL